MREKFGDEFPEGGDRANCKWTIRVPFFFLRLVNISWGERERKRRGRGGGFRVCLFLSN